MKQYRVVLVGGQAQGKTTIYNKITNQNERTSYNRESCTRQVKQGWTTFGQVGFEVIDTPGYNSSEQKYMHVAGILAALTFGKVNRILLIVKYDRDDFIIENVERVFKSIHKYQKLITIIFTYMDNCQPEELDEEKRRISDKLEQKFNIQSIIYQSKNENQQFICEKIEQILNDHKLESPIEISDSEIYQYFDILELNSDSYKLMENHKENIGKNIRKIQIAYRQFIDSLDNNEHLLNILHEVILKIKLEAQEKVEEFEKKNGEEILKMVDAQGNNLQYLHYFELKKKSKMM